VGHRERTLGVLYDDGLGVLGTAAARGRVSDVPHRRGARQRIQELRVENLGNQAGPLVIPDLLPVDGADPRRLLSAVLKGVEAQKGELGGVVQAADGEDAALFLGVLVQAGKEDVGSQLRSP
jgi:hypothetical protein